jgi:hypothetical protein
MKNLLGIAMIALVTAAVVAPSAAAYGVCAGACAEVTYTKTSTITETHVDTQTCVGNLVIQVGVSNSAEFCNEGDDGFVDY